MEKIILFDGVCNFCVGSVQFIIKRDPKGMYKFASLQSETGQTLLQQHQIPSTTDSFVFVDGEKAYIKSSAALRVCKNLTFPWKLLFPLIVIPRPIRDAVYELIARNRYKWFGKKQECMLPSPEIRSRFLQ